MEVYRPHLKPWQEWRENEFWTLEVDDLIKANLDKLKLLYKKLIEAVAFPKKYMQMRHTLLLLQGKHPINKIREK